MNSKTADVNGTKPKSLRTSPEMPHRWQKSRARKQSLLGSQFVYIGVLSDDFAAVDVREELCYHSRPKRQIQEVQWNGNKTNERKPCAAEKAAADPQSGLAGTAPRRRAFGLVFRSLLLFAFPWRVLGCGERSEPHLSMPSTRHGAKSCFSSCYRPL